MEIGDTHLEQLRTAKWLLEKPSLAARLADSVGLPLEKGFGMLPEKWSAAIQKAVNDALMKALDAAVKSLEGRPANPKSGSFHRVAVAAAGAAGGAFGLAGLLLELPLSTVLMLRSIADIAREEGEDLTQMESRLSCLEVFAIGGRQPGDDAAETGYFAIRAALARSVSEAARFLAESGAVNRGAPALVRFITAVSSRFGIAVSEKAAAMAVPVVGAAGGAMVNSIFISHFQDVARGHFTIRRLERIYGAEVIQQQYQAI
ncbi:MAG TPA: EcsC family protein [Acidobacteriota bacterium]|nr:EcsC family protein [Acidobacteriota bacterium]